MQDKPRRTQVLVRLRAETCCWADSSIRAGLYAGCGPGRALRGIVKRKQSCTLGAGVGDALVAAAKAHMVRVHAFFHPGAAAVGG